MNKVFSSPTDPGQKVAPASAVLIGVPIRVGSVCDGNFGNNSATSVKMRLKLQLYAEADCG